MSLEESPQPQTNQNQILYLANEFSETLASILYNSQIFWLDEIGQLERINKGFRDALGQHHIKDAILRKKKHEIPFISKEIVYEQNDGYDSDDSEYLDSKPAFQWFSLDCLFSRWKTKKIVEELVNTENLLKKY